MYYYEAGKINSMTPHTGSVLYSHIPPNLPPHDKQMDAIDSMDNYIPMHSASANQGVVLSCYDPATKKAGNNEDLYAEIPANYNGGGDYESPIAKLAVCTDSEGGKNQENQYENSFVYVRN